jgi:hypothetical protein
MAPPMMMRLTFGIRFSMTPILSETFLPPRMATKGRCGFVIVSPRNLSSFSIKKPITRGLPSMTAGTVYMEALSRWAVPKASST